MESALPLNEWEEWEGEFLFPLTVGLRPIQTNLPIENN